MTARHGGSATEDRGKDSGIAANGRPWVLIVNPRAGGRGRSVDAAARALRAAGVALTVHVPGSRSEAREIAARHAGEEVVVAAFGGDGTMNDVGAPLIGGPAWLAMIPGGTENLTARSAGAPRDAEAAAARLARGRPAGWDTGVLGGRPFIGLAGIGFDAAVCARAEGGWRRAFGQVTYYAAALALAPRRTPTFTLSCPGLEGRRLQLAVISNIPLYGGRLRMNPRADPRDGKLDVAAFPWRGIASRPWQFLAVAPVPGRGWAPPPERVTLTEVSVSSDGPVPVHVDGEPFEAVSPSVAVRPSSLTVVLPA